MPVESRKGIKLRDKGVRQIPLFGDEEDLDVLEPAPVAATSVARPLDLSGGDLPGPERLFAEKEEPCRENAWAGINDLKTLRSKVLLCNACPLRAGAKNVVFGEGNPHARVMFIGEAPGQSEDDLGRPFVGRAGKLLDAVLEEVGLSRQEVFIANIAKCRPPQNRLPEPLEVSACLPHLKAQMRIISPKFVVLLGALSSQTLVDPSLRVTRDRGKWFEKDGIHYLVTFHPAAVLRDELGKRKLVVSDMKSLKARLDQLCQERGL